jgi:Xaa-Pro aminopeptidase
MGFLQDACDLHDAAAYAIPALVYAGRLEREFGADLYRLAMLMGADEYLSNLFVCSSRLAGPMFALHYQNKIIEEGDALNVLFEVPTMVGYYADLHRYFNVGTPAPEMQEVMAAGIELQDYLAGLCKPGIRGKKSLRPATNGLHETDLTLKSACADTVRATDWWSAPILTPSTTWCSRRTCTWPFIRQLRPRGLSFRSATIL